MTEELFDIKNEEIENDDGEDLTYSLDRFGEAVIWGTDWTTETINSQLLKKNIDLDPTFQRRDAWTDSEKSKLIESLMLGLPVPPIILAENKNKKNSYIVIDGKQRLLSIRRFFAEEEKEKTAFKRLKIKGLEILEDINGMYFADIEDAYPEYIRNLENQSIRTIVIKNWPDESFLYTVFLRLNTGSKKLSPQELRQALKPGAFLNYLDDATAESETVRKMLNNSGPDPRMKDIELTLRCFAYHFFFEKYAGQLKEFLDYTCERLNNEWEERQIEIEKFFSDYVDAIEFSYQLMDNKSPFSRYGKNANRFNRSIFELFVFYFTDSKIRELVTKEREAFLLGFREMNNDPDFIKAISGSTKMLNNLEVRFSAFRKLLSGLSDANKISIPMLLLENGKIKIV